jgi:hypothetical protein
VHGLTSEVMLKHPCAPAFQFLQCINMRMWILETCFSMNSIVTLSPENRLDLMLYPAIPANHERQEEEEFILPGEGEVKDWDNFEAECGKTKYTIKCEDKHQCDYPVELKPWDCGRYECPVCFPRALRRGAVGIREHVWNTLVEMKKAWPGTKWIISSVIISAPESVGQMDYEKQHYYLRKSLKKLGTETVAATYHRWRYRDRVTGEILEAVPWREYEQNPERYERVLGVHWHCFTIGRLVGSDKYHKETGFIYKKMNVDNQGKTVPLKKKDIYAIAYYALSHSALSTTRRRHATHYYGNFWRIQITDKRYSTEPIMCPKGGHQRVRRTEFHSGINDCFGLEEPAVKMIVHRKWRLRGVDYPEDSDLDCGLDFTGIDAPVCEVEYVELDNL